MENRSAVPEEEGKRKGRVRKVGSLSVEAYIRLRGKWLEEAGVHSGDKFRVAAQGKQLILKKIEE